MKQLHYHIDERNQIWLNLDYTAKYPGGPFYVRGNTWSVNDKLDFFISMTNSNEFGRAS
jgi:hypothetical protein